MAVTPHDHPQHVPARAATLGMWLFLASLTMLFAASMLAFIMIRFFSGQAVKVYTGDYPLPGILLLSTAIVLLASLTIHLAVNAVRRERIGQLKGWLIATLLLAIVFCIVQAPAMATLLDDARTGGVGRNLFAFMAVLIGVHAAHVVGGVIYLLVVLARAYAGRYDHEHYLGVKHAAMYWHFLDVVWLCMYGILFAAG